MLPPQLNHPRLLIPVQRSNHITWLKQQLRFWICFLCLLAFGRILHADTQGLYVVDQHDLHFKIERTCRVEPGNPWQVFAPLEGKISSILRVGDDVAQGDVLARYSSTQLERQRALAQSQLATTLARIDQLVGPLTEARAQLRNLDMAALERRITAARESYEQVQALFEDGTLAENQTLESKERLRQLEEELVRAQTETSIAQMETDLQIAEQRNIALTQRIAVETLDEQLALVDILSPVHGRVSHVNARLARTGETTVATGLHLFSVSPPQQRWARVELTAAEADSIRNSEVSVRLAHASPATNTEEYTANLEQLVMQEDATAWQKNRFEALVAFEAREGVPVIGSDAVCIFRRRLASDVVAIPLSYVNWRGDAAIVTKVEGNSMTLVEVETGVIEPPYIEIVSGLRRADRIASP